MVAAAEQLARTGRPAEDAMPLVEKCAHGTTGPPSRDDHIDVLAEVAKGLGEAFAQAAAETGSCCSASPSTS